jgi:hypothetical protein
MTSDGVRNDFPPVTRSLDYTKGVADCRRPVVPAHRHVRMGRNLQLSRPTTPYGLICAPPPIGHRSQNDGSGAVVRAGPTHAE